MIQPLFPCIWFDNQAKEAANFYCRLFKNSFLLSENQLVTTFSLNGTKVMALNGGPVFTINPSISLTVYCDSISETDRIWNALIEGGSTYIPIDTWPWSERYGWLADKFGMTWQISSTGKKDGELRILPSMLFVGDKFGLAEKAIHHYSAVIQPCSTDTMVKYPESDPNAGKVMYAEFTLNESPVIAMDGPGEHQYTFNEAVSFVLECDTQEEIDCCWDQFTKEGEESQCGWLKDQFGVSWQIVPTILASLMSDPEKAGKAFQAFREMKKLDLETIMLACI
jgi:predicted 3-demethylubiquinone-9 3-methyltransferase (glyoxalase superfamily)